MAATHEFATSSCAQCGIPTTARSIWFKLPIEMRKELLAAKQLNRREGIYCKTCKQTLFPPAKKQVRTNRKTRADYARLPEAERQLPPGKWVVRKGVRHYVKESA